MPRMKNPEEKIRDLLADLTDYYWQLLEQEKTMEGKPEKKKEKFNRHKFQTAICVTALDDVLWRMGQEMDKYDEQRR